MRAVKINLVTPLLDIILFYFLKDFDHALYKSTQTSLWQAWIWTLNCKEYFAKYFLPGNPLLAGLSLMNGELLEMS